MKKDERPQKKFLGGQCRGVHWEVLIAREDSKISAGQKKKRHTPLSPKRGKKDTESQGTRGVVLTNRKNMRSRTAKTTTQDARRREGEKLWFKRKGKD